jgi:hypothetical protein
MLEGKLIARGLECLTVDQILVDALIELAARGGDWVMPLICAEWCDPLALGG